MEVLVTDFSLRLVHVHLSFGASVGELTRFLSREQGIPYLDFYVTSNGRLLAEDEELQMGGWYRLEPRLCGGKGGFGSMLRALGAQIEKTTNREACRDLSGRRLRDVNHEKEMAEWLKKQADREAEKEQRRLERLQRKLAEPKHYFSDPDYEKQCRDMTERMEESIRKGLQASSSGTSGASRKRSSACAADPGKRPRLWQSGLDAVSSSDDDSEGSDEEPSPSSSSSSSSSSTSQKNSLALLHPKPTKAHSSCGSSSSSPREIPEAVEAGSVTPEVEKEAKREAEPLTQEVGPEAQQEAEPEARRDTEPVSQEAGPETQQEVPSVTQEVGPEAQRGAEVEMEAFQREAKPESQEARPETQLEAQSVTQEVGPEAQRGAEVDMAAVSSTGLQEALQIRSRPENHTQPESRAESTATQPADDSPLDLQTVGGAVELEALGMERLKGELMRLGLKCGGTLQERAARLFSIRGLSRDQIPPSLLAKPTKPKRK